MSELERTNVYLPVIYKQTLAEQGINLSDFVREAMRREFKRRKMKVEKLSEIKPGPRAASADNKEQ